MVVPADSSGPGWFIITSVTTGADGDLINVTFVQVRHTILIVDMCTCVQERILMCDMTL